MKRFLLSIILIFIVSICYPQFFLGLTAKEAFNAIVAQKGNTIPTIEKSKEGEAFMVWENTDVKCFFSLYFDSNRISNSSSVVASDSEHLNLMITAFNNNYVKISPTEWNAYIKGSVIKIKLVYFQKRQVFNITKISSP